MSFTSYGRDIFEGNTLIAQTQMKSEDVESCAGATGLASRIVKLLNAAGHSNIDRCVAALTEMKDRIP